MHACIYREIVGHNSTQFSSLIAIMYLLDTKCGILLHGDYMNVDSETPMLENHWSRQPSANVTVWSVCVWLAAPPDVASFGEERGLDDLRSHPGVGASSRHLGGLVPLPSQAKVRDLQRLSPDVVVLNLFK